MADLRRVLIVKLSAMGDVLHALPLVGYLRARAPGAEIHWAVDQRFAELLEGNPGIAKVVGLPIEEWRKRLFSPATWWEAVQSCLRLRQGKYDVTIDIQGNLKSGVVTGASGAPLRYGFPRDITQERVNTWFTNRRPAAVPQDRHVTQKILRVVTMLFGETSVLGEFHGQVVNTAAETAAAEQLLEEALPGAAPRLALHPGTTWQSKRMDSVFWADTVRILRESFPRLGVYLSWGSFQEQAECQAVRDLAGGSVVLLPRLGYRALAAAYRACGHMIGPDTGPLHLGAVVGIKTVSVFRGTDPLYLAPLGSDHRFVRAPAPCTRCRRVCPRDESCRASIRPSEVAKLMGELMRR